MKKIFKFMFFIIFILLLSSCDLLSGGSFDQAPSYDKEVKSSTGKWYFLDDNLEATNNYFEFNGNDSKMTFNYYENDAKKISGTFRVVVSNDLKEERTYVFMWCLDKKDGEKEDVLYCYADDFSLEAESNFTQFTIMKMLKKMPMKDGDNHDRTYRPSEQPYKMGTYLKENKEYKEEKNEYKYGIYAKYDYYNQIEAGTYILDEDTTFTSYITKPTTYGLFRYQYKDEVVEGLYSMSVNKDAMYLYITHDQYEKVTREDKKIYDTTFNIYYPPDLNVDGNFDSTDGTIVINGFVVLKNSKRYESYHWNTGTYNLEK